MKLLSRSNEIPPKTEITVSNNTILRVMAIVVLTLLGLAALNKVANALILIFLAFFLALALNAPVHWIAEHLPGKRRGDRSVATMISFFIVIVVLLGFLIAVVPPSVRQVSSFIRAVPGLVEDTKQDHNALGKFIRENNLEDTTQNLSDELGNAAKKTGGKAISTLGVLGSSLFATFTVLAMTFMMLVEGPHWVNLAKRFVPLERREHVAGLTRDMYKVVRGYVNGQVTIAFIAAVFVLPVLLILDIPYAGALAAIVFICELIPMIGVYIATVIVTLMGLITSPAAAALILAYYILYQQIENYVLQPRIQATATSMSPLLVFASVIIGVNLNGLIGGLVAIPVMGCIRLLVIDYLQRRGMLESPQPKKVITAGAK
jgi:predicted PurR-regulated permease PerM